MRWPWPSSIAASHASQDPAIFNMTGTPHTHLPVQGPVDKLVADCDALRKREVKLPFPDTDMKVWLPSWAVRKTTFVRQFVGPIFVSFTSHLCCLLRQSVSSSTGSSWVQSWLVVSLEQNSATSALI